MSPRWQQVSLGEVCKFKYGQMPKASDLCDSGYPVFSGYRIVGHANKYHYERPEIIVVARGVGGTGDVKMSPPKCFLTNLSIVAQVVSGEVDQRFLYFRLSGPKLWELRTGSAQAQITIDRLQRYSLKLPPIDEQRKIAGVLGAYDELIENNRRRIEILEEMARRLYREWFVQFRFPGHAHVPLTDSPLGKIPKGWEVVALDSVCERVKDGAHRSPPSVEDGKPMASMKDMDDWGLNLATCRLIAESDFDELVRIGVKPQVGDILIAKDGASYLKYIFVLEDDLDVVLLSSIAFLRTNRRAAPHCLAFHLNEPQTKSRLANYVTGAAIPRIILKDFARFQIPLAPIDLQSRWLAVVGPMISLIHNMRRRNRRLQRTRDLLLPRLISGELDVSELHIEVEEAARDGE